MDSDLKQQGETKLSKEELQRYARHIVLRDVGGPGQQKLKAAKVLVIGAGGLGSPVLQYLAAAGVGTLGIVDDDTVSLSNLQRQIIHDNANVGVLKTTSAAAAITRINPHIKVQQWPIRMTAHNAYALLSQYDIVADGSDNFDTRFMCAQMCDLLHIPLVYAAVGQFEGSITLLKPWEKNTRGELNPSLFDLFPVKPKDGSVPTCQQAGVLGALTGIIGSMQAQEVIKEIIGYGDGLVGRLLMVDARSMRFDIIKYKRTG